MTGSAHRDVTLAREEHRLDVLGDRHYPDDLSDNEVGDVGDIDLCRHTTLLRPWPASLPRRLRLLGKHAHHTFPNRPRCGTQYKDASSSDDDRLVAALEPDNAAPARKIAKQRGKKSKPKKKGPPKEGKVQSKKSAHLYCTLPIAISVHNRPQIRLKFPPSPRPAAVPGEVESAEQEGDGAGPAPRSPRPKPSTTQPPRLGVVARASDSAAPPDTPVVSGERHGCPLHRPALESPVRWRERSLDCPEYAWITGCHSAP